MTTLKIKLKFASLVGKLKVTLRQSSTILGHSGKLDCQVNGCQVQPLGQPGHELKQTLSHSINEHLGTEQRQHEPRQQVNISDQPN
jgi:hypothetical protein